MIHMELVELVRNRCIRKPEQLHSIRPFRYILGETLRAAYDQHHSGIQWLNGCCNHSQRQTNREEDLAFHM